MIKTYIRKKIIILHISMFTALDSKREEKNIVNVMIEGIVWG